MLGENGENDPSVTPAIVVITSKEGIANLNVKIETDNESFAASVGELMPMEFDLAYPGETGESLASIGLPVGDDVIGKTSVDFNITDLAPLLSGFSGHHSFSITVTDSKGNKKSTILKYLAK